MTTGRILERITVHYVSRRMAWKLLKGALFFLLQNLFLHSLDVMIKRINIVKADILILEI